MSSFSPYLNSVNTTSIGIDLFGGNALFLTDTTRTGSLTGSPRQAAAAQPTPSRPPRRCSATTSPSRGSGRHGSQGADRVSAGSWRSCLGGAAGRGDGEVDGRQLRPSPDDNRWRQRLVQPGRLHRGRPCRLDLGGEFTIPSGLATPVGIAQLNVATAATTVAKIAQPTIVDLTRVTSPNLSLGGFEIHDGHRGAAIFGDGRAPETSYGVWRASTNRAQPLDFEVVGLTGWTKTDPAATITATIDTAISKFGLSSLKMVNTTTNEDGFEAINISSPIAATKYAISVWVNSTVQRGGCRQPRPLRLRHSEPCRNRSRQRPSPAPPAAGRG
jgi:hypothetical protein